MIPLILRDSQFQSPVTRVAAPIFYHTHPNIFNKLLIWMNLYQYKKNQAISSFCSRYIFDLKILQYYWPRAFWHKSEEPDFTQIWNLCNNIAYSVNFHYRPHSERSNDEMNNKTDQKTNPISRKRLQRRTDGWRDPTADAGDSKNFGCYRFFSLKYIFYSFKAKIDYKFQP